MASSTKPSHGGTKLTPAPPQNKSDYVGPKARGSKFKQKSNSSVLPVRRTKQPKEPQEYEDDDEDNDGDDEDDEEDFREHTVHAGRLTSLKDVEAKIAARRASQGEKNWEDEDDEEDDEDDEEDYREHAIHASRLTSLKDVMARIAAREAVYIAKEEAQEAVAAKAKVRKEKGDSVARAACPSTTKGYRAKPCFVQMIAEALNYYRHDPKGTTPTSIKRWISYTFNLDNFIIEAQFKSALDYGLGVEKIFKCKKSRSRLVLIDKLQQGGQNSDSDDDEEGGDELDGPRGSGSSGRSQTRAGGGQCRTQPQFGTDGAEGDATAAAEDSQDERGQACLNEGDDSQEERQAQGQSGDEYKENDDDETEPDNNRRYGVIAAAKTSFPAGDTKMFVAHPKNAPAPKSKKGEGLVKIPKALKSTKVPKSTKATQTTAEEAEAEAEGGLKPGIRKSTKKTVVKETSAASAAKFATSSKAATDAKKEAAKETPVSKNAAAAEKVTVKKKTTLNEAVAPKKTFEYIKLAATQTVAAFASALFTNKLAEKSSARVVKKQDKDKDNEAPLHTWVIPSQLFKRKADETVDTEDEELKMKKGTQSLYGKDRRFVPIASGPFKTRGSSGPSKARRV